jgi:hypothetical protein
VKFPLKYEKLHLFYFRCGCVIHGMKGCLIRSQKWMSERDEEKEWGVWLRAEASRRQGQFWQGSGGGLSFRRSKRRRLGGKV